MKEYRQNKNKKRNMVRDHELILIDNGTGKVLFKAQNFDNALYYLMGYIQNQKTKLKKNIK